MPLTRLATSFLLILPKRKTSCLHCRNIQWIVFFIFSHCLPPFAHPLSFKFTLFDFGANNILYEGGAVSSFGAIELINSDDVSQVGWASYAEPVHLWDSSTGTLADFTTRFSFTINTLNKTKNNYGDGFAFFLASAHYQIPPTSFGRYLGLLNRTTFSGGSQNQIVIVEFDTFPNIEWDPPEQHIGININSIYSVVNASWDVDSHGLKPANVWITYNATTKNLSMFMTYDDNPLFMGKSLLSYQVDLKQVLPEWIKIGFSGATGLLSERNRIDLWQFSSNVVDSKVESGKKVQKRRKTSLLVVVVPVCSIILMLGVGISWLVVKKKKKKKKNDGHRNDSVSIDTNLERGAFPKRFSYQELVTATNGFANDRRLGQGASGQVYKGNLSDLGRVIAVKRIFADSRNSDRIFINEVKIISRLIHRNLVQFIGWCHEQGEFLLVYEYMPNCSLDNHLFGDRRTIPWNVRYKIVSGLASAIHYLHEEAEQCVLHRDIKSANILLDTDFSTKLGDFGVAKLADPRFRTQTTGVVGTYGYLAPEYANEGRASKESDVFSFGVVALEIACGRRTYQEGEFYVPLAKWVWQLYLAGNILEAADERLNRDFEKKEMECLLIVGLWCTHPNDKGRPKVGQVIKILQLESPLPDLPHDMHDQVFRPIPLLQQEDDSYCPSITSSLNNEGR